MKKQHRIISGVLSVLLLSTVVGGAGVSASTLKDLQNEKNAVENKKNSLNSTIQKKENEIQVKQTRAEELMGQIKKLNAKIDETNSNMNHLIAEMDQTKKEIKELKESIKELEIRIAERDEVLRERVRVMQIKGGKVSYLDVLLGANSFSDFIDRFSAVTTLMDADRKIIRQQEEDIAQLEDEKQQVETKLAEQEERKKKIQAMKDELDAKKKEKNTLVNKLQAEQEKLSKEKTNLEEEYNDAIEISSELEGQIVAEQNRLAEVARKAEEKRRAEAAAKREREQQQSQSSGGSSASPGNLPAVSSGFWTKPTNGRYSSGFGWRTHPITHAKKQHRGMDLAAPMGTPVVAAGDGVVSYAGSMSGFGNVIMITHSVDGKILTTVYGHLSSISTSSGAHVSKGQYIGAVGTTGFSTGPHLHFELHVGNFSASGPSAVNPLHYVSF
ncbi:MULTISPECIES: murein hydrolase activator EnvC family protein [Sporosarcina]|uniref:murein hydrolase activator EnvC family protein n=1 Tax=Sporosarcina TaxID=1569 RepID=UPI001E36E532|nr:MULTISPECIES: peptidoglycan DD-metalloendopeptidase family protein [Sporosarcina]GKV65833.1 peptidase M24 [Sporosarcina sp. NCCP-2331]GLB55957.1 peptidase M24 [Sporosarcina sp. NCCP-2378]